MEYRAAVDYILRFADYEKMPGIRYILANYDLRRMEEFLERLGNPHLRARTVHVAGTKGKGSTAAMIAGMLTASGYRVGLFTSPHLLTIRERIKVDSELIEEEGLSRLVERVQPEVEGVNRRGTYGQLTTFEILAALAFAYFEERGVDLQVVEVGLGGRLDATNLVQPLVCVITSISFDHTEALGHTLGAIAGEKAGIIKPGCVVVSSPQPAEAAEVIEEVCYRQGARLIRVGIDVTWQKMAADLTAQSLQVKGRGGDYRLAIPLIGDHQLENAATAVAALEALGDSGFRFSGEDMAEGLAQLSWPGRLQILKHRPWVVVDGAHNGDSARRLKESLSQYFDFDQAILVMGTSGDKDIAGMIAEWAPFFQKVIVTQSHHPRAASASVLIAEFARQGMTGQVEESTSSALSLALSMAGDRDLVCVTGSLFVVAEAMEFFSGGM
jgi:dihydrofolate synthase/folylpolyglutamate synthase